MKIEEKILNERINRLIERMNNLVERINKISKGTEISQIAKLRGKDIYNKKSLKKKVSEIEQTAKFLKKAFEGVEE